MRQHWKLGAVVRRGIEVLKEEGVRALVFRALGESVYRRALVVEFVASQPIPTFRTRVPVQAELLRENQVDEYLRFRPDSDRAEIQKRLDEKQWCFAAWDKGRIVSASWVTMHRASIEYLARRVDLSPDEAYVYEIFTEPELRNANVASVVASQVAKHFRNAGYRRLWEIIVPENKPSLRLALKTGYHRCGVMGYLKIGPWRHDFVRWDRAAQLFAQNARADYWGDVLRGLETRGHYLDAFLARMKKDAYLSLIARWGGTSKSGYVLKTDLFEEATGPDAFIADLRCGQNRVIGIDVSHAVVARARSRNGVQGVFWLVADVRQLPFSASNFALVVSPSTLDHFPDPDDLERSLWESRRILAPGGRMIVTLDNRQNISDPLLRLANRLGWLPFNVGHSCTIAELVEALELAGLQVRDTTAILHNPRLIAVGIVRLARKIRWQRLVVLVQQLLVAMQRLGETRLRYRTGSFIAALAVKSGSPNAHSV